MTARARLECHGTEPTRFVDVTFWYTDDAWSVVDFEPSSEVPYRRRRAAVPADPEPLRGDPDDPPGVKPREKGVAVHAVLVRGGQL